MKSKIALVLASLAAVSLGTVVRADNVNFLFSSTSNPSAWLVSFNATGVDAYNNPTNFKTATSAFAQATPVAYRGDYIANNAAGSNGGIGVYTQFVFRQYFDLTGYDAASAVLTFQWAADDTGEGFADRGHWLNRFTFNGPDFLGIDSGGYYNYDPNKIETLSGGFVAGINVIDFYVQGNGQTDGFELRTISFTANKATTHSVPDSGATATLVGGALLGLVLLGRRRLR